MADDDMESGGVEWYIKECGLVDAQDQVKWRILMWEPTGSPTHKRGKWP